ncbi:MAG: twin-arginine translocase TatA/TatE family subunit [Marinoscillum sp.]
MNTVLAFGMPGGWELIVIILFVIIFFGAKKIPEIARGMGKGIREFKDATKEIKNEIDTSAADRSDDTKKK